MDPRKREIEQLEGDIARLEGQIAGECAAIGKNIADLNQGDPRSAELAKYLHSVRTLRKSEDDFRGDISRIRDTVRKIQELDAAVADNERRAKEIALERETKYIELGAGSFTVFKGLADRERWRPFFEAVLKLDVDLERLEEELKSLDEQGKAKGLFQKLKVKGKKIVVRGSISRVERQRMRAFADAGGRVADSEFAALTTGDLRLLFDFAAEKRRAMDGLQEDAGRLREEAARLREALKQHGIDGDPDERCGELEKRIADVRRELDVVYGWMGQLFMEKDLRSDLADAQLSAKFEIVNVLRRSVASKRVQIGRLRAELEIEDLQRKDKTLRQRLKQLEEELKVKQRQIDVVNLEIGAGVKRVDELKHVLTGEAGYTEAPALPPSPDFFSPRPPA